MLGFVLACVLPTIWIVDANSGPGTHFTDLPAAVAAAQNGDTILVRSGTYTAFYVTGKALTIRGAGAPTTVIDLPTGHATHSHLTIAATPLGETFYLSGFTIRAAWSGPSVGALNALAGAKVVIADCSVSGGLSGVLAPQNGRAGLYALAAQVHASRSGFHGGVASYWLGADGAKIEGSVFAADSCEFRGADAPFNPFQIQAGTGLSVSQATATITRCNCTGGFCSNTGHVQLSAIGGNGASATGGASLRVAGTATNTFFGGYGDPGLGSFALSAIGGTVIVHGPVTLQTGVFAGATTSGPVTLNAPLLPYLAINGSLLLSRETNALLPVTVDLDGLFPNALYFLAISDAPDFATAPWGLGEILLSLQASVFHIGLLDATGHLTFAFVPASLPVLLNRPVYSQAGVFDAATGRLRLSQSSIRIFAP